MNSRAFPSRPPRREPLAQPPCPYGDDHDDRSFRSEADSTSLNYSMDPSGPYARPLTPNGFVYVPASSVSERTPSDTGNLVPLRATTTTHDDCKKLKDSNRMLSTVFYVLVTACVLVFLVYIALIVYLVVSLPELTSQSASQSSASTSCGQGRQDGGVSPDRARDGTFCVDERYMDVLVTSYRKESKDSAIDFIKGLSGFQNYWAQNHTFCFRSLSWVPDMMSKINNKILRNVEDIEEKQETINKTVSAYSSANSTRHKCDTDAAGDSVRSDRTKSVLGHFFLDSSKLPSPTAGSNAISSLKWIPQDSVYSVRRGMNVSDQTGKVSIVHTGFYYVYSNVVFKTDTNIDHVVVKEKEEETEETLLQWKLGRASFLQGVFMLQRGDTLRIKATVGELDTDRGQSTYLGLYLIRT